jgi:hypothetical protein
MKKLSILMLCFIFLYSYNSIHSEGVFKEISTKHFRIIFDEDLKNIAYDLYKIADEKAEMLFELFEFKYNKKITISISNSQSEISFALNDSIVISPNNPKSDTSFNHSEDSIEAIFIHELTHVILFSKSRLFPYSINLVARWIHEGIAVYIESKFYKGRGHSTYFTDIPSSFKELTIDNININGEQNYFLGYDFVNFMVNKYGEKKAINKIIDVAAFNLPIFFLNKIKNDNQDKILEDWKNSRVKTPLIGERVISKEATHLGVYKDELFYQSKNYLYKLNTSSKSSSVLMQAKYFFYDDISIKHVLKNKTDTLPNHLAAYDGSKYLDFKNPTVIKRFNGSYIYVSRKNGKESIISDDIIFVSEDYKLSFRDILPLNNRLFFIAKDPQDCNNWLFEIVDNKIFKLFKTDYASVYKNLLYCQKDNTIFQFNTNNNSIQDILVAKNIYSVNRVKDNFYFLMFDEGIQYIHKIAVPSPYNDRKILPLLFKKPIDNSLKYFEDSNFKYTDFSYSLKFKSTASFLHSLNTNSIYLYFLDELDVKGAILNINIVNRDITLTLGNKYYGAAIKYSALTNSEVIAIDGNLTINVDPLDTQLRFYSEISTSISNFSGIYLDYNISLIKEWFYITFSSNFVLGEKPKYIKINLGIPYSSLNISYFTICNQETNINYKIFDLIPGSIDIFTFLQMLINPGFFHTPELVKPFFTEYFCVSYFKDLINIPINSYRLFDTKIIGVKSIDLGINTMLLYSNYYISKPRQEIDKILGIITIYTKFNIKLFYLLDIPIQINLISFKVFGF